MVHVLITKEEDGTFTAITLNLLLCRPLANDVSRWVLVRAGGEFSIAARRLDVELAAGK